MAHIIQFIIKGCLYCISMRKKCSFEQNVIHNLQIEQFQQIIKIQGLSHNKPTPDTFPSIRHLFNQTNLLSIIGDGPNANIQSFYYLLLCHIRKQHCLKLLNDLKQKQIEQQEKEPLERRDRRVSFNDKGALFVRGPQYENYCLHKLKMFAFSKETHFQSIVDGPLELDSSLFYQGKALSTAMKKKLLSQFLRLILPRHLTTTYRESFKSIQHYLNRNRCISEILTALMRHVLLQKYDIESARNYRQQINDHTVCSTLCDAFEIDGLLCKENLYEINTWCRVTSLTLQHNKLFIVNIFNDQFEQLGLKNEALIAQTQQKGKEVNYYRHNLNVQSEANQHSFHNSAQNNTKEINESISNSSVMASNQESEIPDSQSSSQPNTNTQPAIASTNTEGASGKGNIINNNISNNIYLNVNANESGKPYLYPLINISTLPQNKNHQFAYLNIQLS